MPEPEEITETAKRLLGGAGNWSVMDMLQLAAINPEDALAAYETTRETMVAMDIKRGDCILGVATFLLSELWRPFPGDEDDLQEVAGEAKQIIEAFDQETRFKSTYIARLLATTLFLFFVSTTVAARENGP